MKISYLFIGISVLIIILCGIYIGNNNHLTIKSKYTFAFMDSVDVNLEFVTTQYKIKIEVSLWDSTFSNPFLVTDWLDCIPNENFIYTLFLPFDSLRVFWRGQHKLDTLLSPWSTIFYFDLIIIKDIKVYPTLCSGCDGINFKNLPNGSKLTIYNILGKKVREYANIKTNEIKWDLKNKKGKIVSSGVYFYIVKYKIDHKLRLAKGKISYIK